uniref:P-type Ca(2+) transporter n=1 Tax=Salix viminalis TaxID=40686 RepID=A0A6N2N2B0_SALVM
MEKVDKICVLARSSPLDKLLMVKCLKQKGHVVAVTGDGTNDAPALKEADIGLSMGIQGTEVAKESSDIVILDDNFASVATVLRWGRCVYNNIQKFIQFQLTVNVAALVINFVAAVSAGEVPLTAVQLLWVTLIMNTLGALALATEQPAQELMEKNPVGLVGIKDPCRPGVKKAVDDCQRAGVNIKMITGDNVFTARAIAIECGILKPGAENIIGAVVEGEEFRNYSQEQRMEKVDKICVLARSSPLDKLLMVKCLKQKGHVVAVTGDGTNDAPALKEADIGLSMGIQGTEVAKESSDIVILDDNFASVATVLRWGRCVYNNIQKFIQFQLTVNVAALVINFVAAVSAGEVPLTAVQLLWVTLIMNTLGALALATEQPAQELMEKNPVGRTETLITNIIQSQNEKYVGMHTFVPEMKMKSPCLEGSKNAILP